MEELRGLEQIVFVVLLDDAELFRIGERAEMDGRGIDGRGDVHELQTKSAVGKQEIADVADQSDVGIVDRDVEIGLIVQAGGLIGGASAASFLLLRHVSSVRKGHGVKRRRTCRENGGRNRVLDRIPGIFIAFTSI